MNRLLRVFTAFTLMTVLAMGGARAQDEDDLLDMSLEDLMNLEVTSVSKKAERLQDVASAIYVVSSDDIMKSGATNLHEVLRTVPGYWGVQDEYSSVYATIRNSPVENVFPGTVLYLLDGTPIQDLMGSTFSFQNFDIPLEEIDRIEVIKGSGGTIYGANSATGVISIFTKNPESYDGINARVEGAAPGYMNTSIRAGGQLSEKVALSGYAKFRYFSGYESMVGKDENGNATGVDTKYTKDYDASNSYSMGAKIHVALNEKSSLSGRLHYNILQKTAYTTSYDRAFVISRESNIKENDVNANRLVANIKFERNVSDKHNYFIRFSTNHENDLYRAAGGVKISNGIYDFEFQDNFTIGINDFSAGLNYRAVQFDLHDVNDPLYINFSNPQANETLTGAFIQDKINMASGRFNVVLGIKAENYSLVNDNYYFSPMVKASYLPSENLTLWGGFTQSYTTPGFNNTNVDWFLFQTPEPAEWEQIVTGQVYQEVYQQAIDGGADEAMADAAAQAFLASPTGQATVAAGTASAVDNVPNIAAKNGTHTVPTKFQTLEFGFKANVFKKYQFQSNYFHTIITDGVSVNPGDALLTNEESTTQPGRFADYYLYGNYVKGNSDGVETLIRGGVIKGLILEASHTWQRTNWEYQENEDLASIDPADLAVDPTPNPAFVPEHVFRFKADYSFGTGFNIIGSVMTTSKFRTQNNYYFATERYENPVEDDIAPITGVTPGVSLIAENTNRTIVNLRVEKAFKDGKWSIYGFGNDITNKGIIANTDALKNVTLSKIGAMYGAGINFKFK